MSKWFWRTLSGYTVTFATVHKYYHVKHRPFRQPLMWTEHPKAAGGKSLTHIFFDEYSEMDLPIATTTISVGVAKTTKPVNLIKG